MCCDETAEYSVRDGWPNGDVGGRKLRRLARGCRVGTSDSELGTGDIDEQSRLWNNQPVQLIAPATVLTVVL